MKYILSLLALVISYTSFGQVTVTAAGSCTSYTLTASVTGLVPTASGITGDDSWSGVIPIGFSYTFYGAAHTQCIIGSNGEVGFDLSNAGAYNTWPISATLASTATSSSDIHNLIAGPWCDIYIPAGGTIMYSTVGTAPNRKFEVTWCGTRMYSCTGQWVTTQIIIYETTGIAEVHIAHHTWNIPSVCGWNGNYAEVGVVNSTGSSATVAPGRDFPSTWNATNEAWRFTPVGTTSYTVSSIPYAPIPYASSAVYWYDSATHAYLGTGTTITVTPSVTTTYKAAAVGCGDTSFAYITVVGLGGGSSGPVPHISGITFTNPTACGLCNGTVTLHGLIPGLIDTVFHALAGVAQPNIVTTAAADSTITITGLCAGFYNYFYVKVGNCPSNQLPVTLVDPVLTISGETFTNPSICGLCDGSITIHGLWPGGSATINYMKGGVPQTPVTATVASDSTVILTGLCAGSYTGITATITGCVASGPNILITNPIMAISAEDKTDPTVCGKCDGSITLHGLHPLLPVSVAYVKDGVPQTPYTGTVAADSTVILTGLCAGNYTGIIASIYGCTAPAPNTTLVDPPPYMPSFDYSIHLGCQGDTVFLVNTTTPAGYTSTWNFGDLSPTSTLTNPPPHVYNDVATNHRGTYYITLFYQTYGTGCQLLVQDTITFNHPDSAALSANVYTQCLGTPINFSSTNSIPSSPWATYLWSFGDGTTSTLADPSHPYGEGGVYPVSLVVTDTVGCHDTAQNLINIVHVEIESAIHDTSVCLRMPMMLPTFTQAFGTFDSLTYLWTTTSPGFGYLNNYTIPDPMFKGLGEYVYTVTVTAWPLGCQASDTVHIHSYPPINLNITTVSPQTIPYGSSIQLDATGALYYTWTPNNGTLDNPDINNPIATPTDSMTVYYVYGMNEFGCKNVDSVIVYVDNTMMTFVPSGFTPNGDGLNDVFSIGKLSFQRLIDFRVFNRWGTVVFQTADRNKGWDGTYQGVPQDLGVYTYEVVVGMVDGSEKIYKGTVTLIR